MSMQEGKMKYTSSIHSNSVNSDRWEHSGFATLEKEHSRSQQHLQKTASPLETRVPSINDKWVHDKTQQPISPINALGKKTRRPDRVLYKHPCKQEKPLSKLDETDEKPPVKHSEEKEANQTSYDDEISVASTNVSSDKHKWSSEDKAEDLSTIRNESDTTSSDTPRLVRDIDTPFFELSITFSEEVTTELKIYEVII